MPTTRPLIQIHDAETGEDTTREMNDAEFAEWQAQQQQVTVPAQVEPRQARLALIDAGLLDKVSAALASIKDAKERQIAQTEWEYALVIKRASTWIASLQGGLGLTDAQIDALFIAASKK